MGKHDRRQSSLSRSDADSEARKITDRVYDILHEKGYKLSSYPAVRKVVRDLLDTYNHDAVAIAVETTARSEASRFGPWSLSTSWIGKLIQDARVPDGLWEFERWYRELPDFDERKRPAMEWLAQWRDAYRSSSTDAELQAQRKLLELKGESPDRELTVIL